MAQFGTTFKAEDAEPDFAPIPAGDYVCEIEKAEIKAMRDDKGDMLSLTLKVVHGDFEGRKVFDNLCYGHKESEMARNIANGKISKIAEVGGVGEINDSDQMIGLTVGCNIKIKDDRNNIGSYKLTKNVRNTPTKAALKSSFGGGGLKEVLDDDVPF